MLTAFAKPKVNLFLHVTGRRDDGYHLLESLVVFPDGGDKLSLSPGDELSLTTTGPFSDEVGRAEDNLVLKAAKLLSSSLPDLPGAHITLSKNLPVASGIGGGSADAATALTLLNQFWRLNKTPEELAKVGLELGADVPACLFGKPAIMRGIGEKLTPLSNLPYFHLVLANPGLAISTPDVFKRLSPPFTDEDPSSENLPTELSELVDWIGHRSNDLQSVAIELVPEIATVLEEISSQSNCLLSRMSGSGATCFGIFAMKEEAKRAAKNIKSCYPTWNVSTHSHFETSPNE